MRIYIFKSEANGALCAFAGDADGSKLPTQFAPWHSEGVIEASERPPHNFSRIRIEGAIRVNGFQLWRMKQPAAIDRSPSINIRQERSGSESA
jgi:hypothetical protein